MYTKLIKLVGHEFTVALMLLQPTSTSRNLNLYMPQGYKIETQGQLSTNHPSGLRLKPIISHFLTLLPPILWKVSP